MALMNHVVGRLQMLGCLWIIGADWNMDPSSIQDGYWAHVTRGVVVAPTSPLGTCRASEGDPQTYDYFLVHRALDPLVKGGVDRGGMATRPAQTSVPGAAGDAA